jgi:hypothetical protein
MYDECFDDTWKKLQKQNPVHSKKIRDSARGENCTMNSPCCNHNTETTVFCHLNESFAGKGLGLKSVDIGFYGCYACHKAYDEGKLEDEYFYLLRAVIKTWLRMMEKGLVKV